MLLRLAISILLILFSSVIFTAETKEIVSVTWYLEFKGVSPFHPKSLQVKLKQSGLKLKGYYLDDKRQIHYLSGRLTPSSLNEWDFYLEEKKRPVKDIYNVRLKNMFMKMSLGN